MLKNVLNYPDEPKTATVKTQYAYRVVAEEEDKLLEHVFGVNNQGFFNLWHYLELRKKSK